MHELLTIQEQFQRYLLTPPQPVPDFFISTKKVSAHERLDIYLNAYQSRLVEALATSYPALQHCLGNQSFSALGLAYLDSYPSCYRSIRWFGDRLAEFIATQKKYAQHPHLVELAKLEWLFCDIFDSADHDSLTLEDMTQIPPERWPEMRFQFHPAVRRFNSHWNVVPLRDTLLNKKRRPSPKYYHSAVPWVLWRKALSTSFCSITEIEAGALDSAMAGKSWQEICEYVNNWMDETEIPSYIASLLKRWIIEGLISTVNV